MFVTDNMSKFARSSKNCEKLEKSQFLLKLIKSSVTGGTRVSSKNCDFCNFCDSSKNCEKLEKSQFLLKLIKSSGTGVEGCPTKKLQFLENCEKMEKPQFLLKLITTSVRGGKGRPAKTAISAISPKIAKNWGNRSYC